MGYTVRLSSLSPTSYGEEIGTLETKDLHTAMLAFWAMEAMYRETTQIEVENYRHEVIHATYELPIG